MYFPSLCVDNFLHDPNRLIGFSKTLEMNSCSVRGGIWPGLRSEDIKAVNQGVYHTLSRKILSLFYTKINNGEIDYDIEMRFQLTKPGMYGDINEGWVHRDGTIASGIIYLTEDIHQNCGTSLFVPNSLDNEIYDSKLVDLKKEMYCEFNKEKESIYLNAIKAHNSKYIEVNRFSSMFNRLVMFDGNLHHGVPSFWDESKKDRLTVVFFINKLKVNYLPIPNTRYFLL